MKKIILLILILFIGTFSFAQQVKGFDGIPFGVDSSYVLNVIDVKKFTVLEKESHLLMREKDFTLIHNIEMDKFYHFTNNKFDSGGFMFTGSNVKTLTAVFSRLLYKMQIDFGKEFDGIDYATNKESYSLAIPEDYIKAVFDKSTRFFEFYWFNIKSQKVMLKIYKYDNDNVGIAIVYLE